MPSGPGASFEAARGALVAADTKNGEGLGREVAARGVAVARGRKRGREDAGCEFGFGAEGVEGGDERG